jgi:DNA-directed RNA polymerase specialized sigma24 family protein
MTSSFHDTRWTLVTRAKARDQPGREALSDLCAAYYPPVMAFLRGEGRCEDEARELAHAFAARLLSGSGIAGADAQRGRFRTYLLGALKHFLADERARSQTLKRGGEAPHERLVTAHDEGIADCRELTPEAAFDRQWALSVLDHGLHDLAAELEREGKAKLFSRLKPWLIGDADPASQTSIARDLGISTDAVKTALHRLRKRMRASVRQRIADTLRDEGTVEEEFAHLQAALRSPRS